MDSLVTATYFMANHRIFSTLPQPSSLTKQSSFKETLTARVDTDCVNALGRVQHIQNTKD